MDCMKDFVGPFNGCDAPTPLSNMYLSQLPGIEFDNLDQVANSDQITWQGVWNDLQATATDTFKEDIIAEFGKRYLLKQITQTVDIGKNINLTTLSIPGAGVKKGIIIETLEKNEQCTCSNLMQIYIQSVNFYWHGTNGTPSFTLYFQDADLGNVEYQVTTSAVAGWNNVWIDKPFVASRLRIVVDGNMDDFVQLDIADFNLDNFGGSYWGNADRSWLYFNWGGCGCQSRIRGVSYDPGMGLDETGSNTYGLSVIMSSKCNWDSIVCNNKKHFASAWQHCLAIEFLNYRINSSRLNRWTTIDKKQAIELQTLYTHKYRGGMDEKTGLTYPGKLQNSITSIVLNDSDCCFSANDYLIWRETRM